MLDSTLAKIRRYIPLKLFRSLQPAYHWGLSLLAAVIYRFPSRKIKVIGVTGTKGKSSTVEILNAIMEEAGYKTALSNTIRIKVGDASSDNLYKMSMPGRFFAQRLIRRAIKAKCDYMILEITSQAAQLYRNRFIYLDAFVFTNLSPEHIEAHGSFDNYAAAKVSICDSLTRAKKQNRTIIANGDDKEAFRFLDCHADKKITFSVQDGAPYEIKKEGLEYTLGGRPVHSYLSGLFNLYNILAASAAARSQGVSDEIIARTIEKFDGIPGRVQKIELDPSVIAVNPTAQKQDFTVIVDYAHTPDSLEKLYQVFQNSKNICVLGGTGGGRDSWKRAKMGHVADEYCDEIILTDEDPYDEDPRKIVDDVAKGITSQQPTIIMDRRTAIAEAVKRAQTGDSILITGKGTDPYIMGPNGSKIPWSDAKVAREEIAKVLISRLN